MAIITLTTDWQQSDFYIGVVKGRILELCPSVTIVDISHNIQPFAFAQAAFVLRNAFTHFPKGSIHIIAVKEEASPGKGFICAHAEGHFFLTADNGLLSLVLDKQPETTVALASDKNGTFPTAEIFCPAAAKLAQGNSIASLGTGVDAIYQQIPLLPTYDESSITGSVVYIDSYKNAITNITKSLFDQVCKGRSFEIFVQSNHNRITRINQRYSETTEGELLAIFNSVGLLETAIYNGNVADLLNLGTNSKVRIKFNDKK
jgi:S-adenosyl-L-methionine hydrolase (adenosine-forming)